MDTMSSIGGSNGTYIKVCGHIATFDRGNVPVDGYCFYVIGGEPRGSWTMMYQGQVLGQGTVSSPVSVGAWQTVALVLQGSSGASEGVFQVTGMLNGTTYHSGAYNLSAGYGLGAIGCGWHRSSFDDFAAAPAPTLV